MNIVLIGTGNVATQLGPFLKKNGHKIIQLYSRSQNSGQMLAKKLKCPLTNTYSNLSTDADLYIIALRDEAISSFLKALPFIPNLIVHTSGSIGLDVFPGKMINTGVIYPLQTFSKLNKKIPEKIPFLIEGSNRKSLLIIRKLTTSISKLVFKTNSSDRVLIHLSAVFANNFTNYLFVMAGKILHKNKIPFNILRPLILETALKVQTNLPEKMQTGPAVRGDAIIIRKHLKLLKNFSEIKDIYKLMSKSIAKEYGPQL